MQVQIIRQWSECEALRSEWNRLAEMRSMHSFEWHAAWWNHYARQLSSPLSLFVLRVTEGESTQALVPLCRSRSALYGSQLEWIGGRKVCTDDNTVLLDPQASPQVLQEIASTIAQLGREGEWDRLAWDGIATNDPVMAELSRSLATRGIPILSIAGPNCWSAELPIQWELYLQSLSKRARRLLRQQHQTYVATGRATLIEPKSASEIEEALTYLRELHQHRWEEKNIEGCFSDQGFGAFLQSVCFDMAAAGRLYLRLLKIDGEMAAGAVGFWDDDRLNLYLVGMEPRLEEHRPGWTLNVFTIQSAIERGVQHLDFLRGDEPYKARLGARPRSQCRWVAAAPRSLPRLRHMAYQAGSWLKKHWPQTTSQPTEIATPE